MQSVGTTGIMEKPEVLGANMFGCVATGAAAPVFIVGGAVGKVGGTIAAGFLCSDSAVAIVVVAGFAISPILLGKIDMLKNENSQIFDIIVLTSMIIGIAIFFISFYISNLLYSKKDF